MSVLLSASVERFIVSRMLDKKITVYHRFNVFNGIFFYRFSSFFTIFHIFSLFFKTFHRLSLFSLFKKQFLTVFLPFSTIFFLSLFSTVFHFASVLLSANDERFSVSRMQDFFCKISVLVIFPFWWHFSFDNILVLYFDWLPVPWLPGDLYIASQGLQPNNQQTALQI